jgi:hypothetical protein
LDEVANDPRRADALPSELTPGRPLAAASRRLRGPAGRPRAVRSSGLPVQGSPLESALGAAIPADFAGTLPRLDWPRGLPLPLAARYAGIPVRRLWALIAAGVLPVIRVPGMRKVLVLRDDLDMLLLAHRGAHASESEAAKKRG